MVTPQEQTPPGADPPRRSMCGRYASYWNAFLLSSLFDISRWPPSIKRWFFKHGVSWPEIIHEVLLQCCFHFTIGSTDNTIGSLNREILHQGASRGVNSIVNFSHMRLFLISFFLTHNLTIQKPQALSISTGIVFQLNIFTGARRVKGVDVCVYKHLYPV